MRKPPGLRSNWLPSQGTAPAAATAAAPAAPTIPAAPPRGTAAQARATGRATARACHEAPPARSLADAPAWRSPDPLVTQPLTPRVATETAAAVVTPPSADGHWQLRGLPGQNLVLMPGQMYLGQDVASLRTLLGSCIAITLWHPLRRIGGMCHFLLPSRKRRTSDPVDGRYGDEAVAEMVRALVALRTDPRDYVANLYGGADTISGTSAACFNVGERNIAQGWALIEQYGFQLADADVGADIPRTVTLTLASGAVTMRRGAGLVADDLRG